MGGCHMNAKGLSSLYTFFIIVLFQTSTFATFSITAVDTVSKLVGSAGASCISGSIILSDVHPGKGIVHTQAAYNRTNQSRARDYMRRGDSPKDIVRKVTNNDAQNNPHTRQYGVVHLDHIGESAGYTGRNCGNYKSHIIGRNYTIQGNILSGQPILDSMEVRFLNTEGTFMDKMMAALQGAKKRGADTRCRRYNKSTISAFIRVAKPNDNVNDMYLDLNVNNTSGSTDPIDLLQRKYDEWANNNVGIHTPLSSSGSKVTVRQNYPNPFTHTTTLRYTLLKPAKVNLNIYNTAGKAIKTLVNHNQVPGKYTIQWNSDDEEDNPVIGGVYVCKLTVDSQVQTFRMLLVK